MKVVYLLCEEEYGGMFSSFTLPIGYAFTTEEDARKWVAEKPSTRLFSAIIIADNYEELQKMDSSRTTLP